VVTHQLQVECRTGKVRWSTTNVLRTWMQFDALC